MNAAAEAPAHLSVDDRIDLRRQQAKAPPLERLGDPPSCDGRSRFKSKPPVLMRIEDEAMRGHVATGHAGRTKSPPDIHRQPS